MFEQYVSSVLGHMHTLLIQFSTTSVGVKVGDREQKTAQNEAHMATYVWFISTDKLRGGLLTDGMYGGSCHFK